MSSLVDYHFCEHATWQGILPVVGHSLQSRIEQEKMIVSSVKDDMANV